MELRQLRHLAAVVEHASFARAAEEFGLTQSALTQSIAKLEGELGVKLLERGRFGAVATEGGKLLISRAKLIDAETNRAIKEIEAYKGGISGDIRIGVGKSLLNGLIPDTLARFLTMWPDVVVTACEGISSDLFRHVLNGDYDFSVSAPSEAQDLAPELKQVRLYSQQVTAMVRAGHPLLSLPSPSLSDTSDFPWIVAPAGGRRVEKLRQMFTMSDHVPPSRFIRTDSTPLAEQMIRQTDAIAVGAVDLLNEAVVALPLKEFETSRSIVITKLRKSRLSPLAAHLEKQFIETARLHYGPQ